MDPNMKKIANDLAEHSRAQEMRDYKSYNGCRVVRGLCDTIHEYITEHQPYVTWKYAYPLYWEEDGDCKNCDLLGWVRRWEFHVPGLGNVSLEWTDTQDRGRTWLKNRDREFRRALDELENETNQHELSKDLVCGLGCGDSSEGKENIGDGCGGEFDEVIMHSKSQCMV